MPLPTTTTLLVAAAIFASILSNAAQLAVVSALIGLAVFNEGLRALVARPPSPRLASSTYEIPTERSGLPVRTRTPFGESE